MAWPLQRTSTNRWSLQLDSVKELINMTCSGVVTDIHYLETTDQNTFGQRQPEYWFPSMKCARCFLTYFYLGIPDISSWHRAKRIIKLVDRQRTSRISLCLDYSDSPNSRSKFIGAVSPSYIGHSCENQVRYRNRPRWWFIKNFRFKFTYL